VSYWLLLPVGLISLVWIALALCSTASLLPDASVEKKEEVACDVLS
jgi:hypothetical protein